MARIGICEDDASVRHALVEMLTSADHVVVTARNGHEALAAEWNDRDLKSRFHLGPGTDEFSQLGNTLDALLDRVAQALRSEQQLTAELAHELRTPLTTIRAEAELGTLSEVDKLTHDRLRRVIAQVDRLDGTIATLLALARHQHGAVRTADLATVIGGLVESLGGQDGSGVPISVSFGPAADQGSPGPATSGERGCGLAPKDVRILGSADLVERVIAPVLDNAVRYAATAVQIEVLQTRDDILVRIYDDGPGIVSEYEDDVFLAGVGDPDTDGAGLGLPLSRRVAAGLGGSSRFAATRRRRLSRSGSRPDDELLQIGAAAVPSAFVTVWWGRGLVRDSRGQLVAPGSASSRPPGDEPMAVSRPQRQPGSWGDSRLDARALFRSPHTPRRAVVVEPGPPADTGGHRHQVAVRRHPERGHRGSCDEQDRETQHHEALEAR